MGRAVADRRITSTWLTREQERQRIAAAERAPFGVVAVDASAEERARYRRDLLERVEEFWRGGSR